MKVALAMPKLEVAGMDEQLRGGSTSNTPHKKNEREKEKKKYVCTIPLNIKKVYRCPEQ